MQSDLKPWAIPAILAMLVTPATLAPLEDAHAEIPVSLELVLAVDSSMSVDGYEFFLQMKGIANAFRDPEIIGLIGRQNGVAVTLFQWSVEIDEAHMIPWLLLHGPASVLAFARLVEKTERNPTRRFTGIGRAIDFGVRLIAGNAYAGQHMKIDISGDGADNIGTLTEQSHRRASDLGIVINGLPILTTNQDLDSYYRDYVIAGPGAFVEAADDYDDFARAFLRKLRREISLPPMSRAPPAPRVLTSVHVPEAAFVAHLHAPAEQDQGAAEDQQPSPRYDHGAAEGAGAADFGGLDPGVDIGGGEIIGPDRKRPRPAGGGVKHPQGFPPPGSWICENHYSMAADRHPSGFALLRRDPT